MLIGWQERVDLPLLGVTGLKAKIDTGARTSALHATDIEAFERDGVQWVRFHTGFDDDAHDTNAEAPVHDRREITNTSGIPETRYVIRTKFRIAGRLWSIDLSLADRSGMTFRMIVGRTALRRHKIAVHPGKRNLTTNATAKRPKGKDSS
ncbi:ATP-dependent zinc protease family protein [Jannaschia ovalis]|uniref:RimK/LysX family protein n=2 Tax=Jannaschia ovalis TaxID=3038773 RepID=A0ABY8LGT4_9RHOB|nr:RimK/LysX family protein [Jannaschia sp. GRR-S6-38]WGH79862.1 RimK/LysX family protein [Jannaschia sp. GRR-S6-38]